MIVRTSRLLRACAPLAVLALSACASTQQATSYYTLMPDSSAAAATSDNSYQIEVMPVEIPLQVDVAQMVVRSGNGELVPVDTRRWIAPLGNEIRNSLSWQLTHALGVRDVSGFGRSNSAPVYRVNLRVQRFDSAPGSYARIDALWSVRNSNGDAAVAVCSSSANINVGSGYPALAQGHQQAIAQIAGEIAASIRAARSSSTAPACVSNH
jgi:hypothetical protein